MQAKVLKNQDILNAVKTLKALSAQRAKTIFKFKIARNLQLLEPITQVLALVRDGSDIPGAVEFFKLRAGIYDRHKAGDLDTLGVKSEFENLENEYKDTVKALLDREKEYIDLLKKKSDISILMFNLEDFPGETEVDLTDLLPFIEEPEDA